MSLNKADNLKSLSLSSLSHIDTGFVGISQLNEPAPKPRRRLADGHKDRADGLDVLIQKTKAIGLRVGEEGLSPNENGNEWLDALNKRGENLLWGMRKIRKYVCGDGSDVHARELIDHHVLERLLYFLDEQTDNDVVFENLWILTNIAAGPTEHTTALVEKGFLQPLGMLLNHPLGTIRTQAAWAIGNIIGDREGYRDEVLKRGFLPSILQIHKGSGLDSAGQRESFRIALWIVDNMCRYKPDWHLMKPAFEILPHVLQQNESTILKECCWAIARILHQSGRNREIDAMIDQAMCTRMVEILTWNKSLTTHPILRALINLACSKNPNHLQYIVKAGVIHELEKYLINSSLIGINQTFDLFAVQILGNLAVHKTHAETVVGHNSLCTWMIRNFSGNRDLELRNEILITLRNLVFHRDPEIAKSLANNGLLYALYDFSNDSPPGSKIELVWIEAVTHIMHSKMLDADFVSKTKLKFRSYGAFFLSLGIFEKLVQIYTKSSGQDLDEMEQDGWGEESNAEDSDSDNEEEAPKTFQAIPFEISNPHNPHHPHFYQQQYHSSGVSVNEKLKTRSLAILREFFPSEFNERIKESRAQSQVCRDIDNLALGSSNNHLADLVSSFGMMNSDQKQK
ncbi:Importin alpha subunit (Karyopherin alpha subunit) (Serine-rich RNA polymerase I suppressor protein) [Terramyces sp. JEL0728]|nr:Importin alpha subunit (Karyopherin alpha subunit) (Serine-rich RNA polymerase I suppressor protein) [Terramyces sp. JEL0728]